MKTTGVALVTGSSIGIGLETSLALARNGIHTFATMRDDQKGGTIKAIANEEGLLIEVLKMDVDDKDSVRKTMLEIIDRTGIPGECAYSSSKFALEGLSESISYELQSFGIKVILIESGVINTNFVSSIRYPKKVQYKSTEAERGNNAYQSHYSRTIDAFLLSYYSAMKNAPSPSLVSAVIIEAINNAILSSQCLFRYTVGDDSRSLALAKKVYV